MEIGTWKRETLVFHCRISIFHYQFPISNNQFLPFFMKTLLSKIAFGAVLLLLTTGFGFRCNQANIASLPPVTLEYWRVFDNEDTMTDILDNFKAAHPNIDIVYRKFRYDEYEQQLLTAFAEDRAPDLFSMPNTWVHRYQRQLVPAPAETVLPILVLKGSLKKEQVVEFEHSPTPTPRDIQNQFVDTVAPDVVIDNNVMALPLALDTMALFYNKQLFAQAGIPNPPKTWKEVQDMAPKLTKLSPKGEVLQSAIALGGSKNIPRSFDILSTLMMQNGATMAARDGSPLFDKLPPNSQSETVPGVQAVEFYTDFANPLKATYTWNETLPGAAELFSQGRLAMFLGYSYQVEALHRAAPQIDWAVTPLPQVDQNFRVEAANYWVEGVSAKSKHQNEAWGLIQYATNEKAVGSYLAITKKPTALRSLVADAKNLEQPYPLFTDAVLTAKSWYHGEDPAAAESAFHTLIDAALIPKDDLDINKLTRQAANQVSATLTRQRP